MSIREYLCMYSIFIICSDGYYNQFSKSVEIVVIVFFAWIMIRIYYCVFVHRCSRILTNRCFFFRVNYGRIMICYCVFVHRCLRILTNRCFSFVWIMVGVWFVIVYLCTGVYGYSRIDAFLSRELWSDYDLLLCIYAQMFTDKRFWNFIW